MEMGSGRTLANRYVRRLVSFPGIPDDKLALSSRMLEKINLWRTNANAPCLMLGDSPVPQLQAAFCLDTGVPSFWNSEGLKPYVRYSLAGGVQAHEEAFYHETLHSEPSVLDLEALLDRAVSALAEDHSFGNPMLSPWVRKASIALVWNAERFFAFLLFEGDYVQYVSYPRLSAGKLELSGRTRNGMTFSNPEDLSASLWYDPPPYAPTLNQLVRVWVSDRGTIVGALRRPLHDNRYWQEDAGSFDLARYGNPESFPRDAPMPSDALELLAMMDRAKQSDRQVQPTLVSFPYVTCSQWDIGSDYFTVSADLSQILREWGHGIYTLRLASRPGPQKEPVNFSTFSILHEESSSRKLLN